MKIRKKVVIMIMVIALCISAFAIPVLTVSASSSLGYHKIISQAPLRTGPANSYSIITYMPVGSKFYVIYGLCNPAGNAWAYGTYENAATGTCINGYVYEPHLN
jgi:hypothetical protein